MIWIKLLKACADFAWCYAISFESGQLMVLAKPAIRVMLVMPVMPVMASRKAFISNKREFSTAVRSSVKKLG